MKRVLITGGSRGIGAETVRTFAKNGDRVAFFYRENRGAAEAVAAETGAVAICCDVADPTAVRIGVIEAVAALGGGIEVLVNNAGVAHMGLSRDMTDAEWRHVTDTNLSAAFYLSREVQQYMIPCGWGRIIHIGSMWGKVGASCEVAYSAAKAGLRGLTMALCKELGPSGITVNCVEPGVIDTEMNRALDEDTRRELAEATPLCRIGTPAEVAEVVLFLASDAASFITGQCLGVDGGFAV
ncbi:MAG: SDR family oxidoreductase [Ruminococcaceae bacterium]|nr:SDR family oxidoreductase [Oscillospiraceae bacterium]